MTCPLGARCDTASGRCVADRCVGVSCPGGTVCSNGQCVRAPRSDAGTMDATVTDAATTDAGRVADVVTVDGSRDAGMDAVADADLLYDPNAGDGCACGVPQGRVSMRAWWGALALAALVARRRRAKVSR